MSITPIITPPPPKPGSREKAPAKTTPTKKDKKK